jgi:hypothetical protein
MSTVPAEIQFFIDINEQVFPYARSIKGYIGKGMYAILQSMKEEPKQVGESQLLNKGYREVYGSNIANRVFWFGRVDSFVNPAFIVDNIGCPQQSLFVLTPRSQWAKSFL